MHIGMGLVCGSKIKDMVNAGFDFTIFLADWHSLINNKLGGEMENIRLCGEYFKECFSSLGIPPSIRYVWASELTGSSDYWMKVIKIAKAASFQRIKRTLPIMGRSADLADIETAALFYPCMQAADIFQLDLDLACAGIDQRKAHMLARDAAEKLNRQKPTCLHTPLLMGLEGPSEDQQLDEDDKRSAEISSKMSKSIPGSCIFVHDAPDDIRKKIINAYCPPKVVANNPLMEIARYILFPEFGSLDMDRSAKFGGSLSFSTPAELEATYRDGKLHPLDLKNAIADGISKLTQPVRDHFNKKPELLEKMLELEVTR